ncbi:MAG: hypothetical protein OEW79_11155 [Betaproteobacteria bacterium]|jgi:4,5-dihydroxyphthalate decarboxylase|nr:hypothetical protein [Betaproteobacteria bacterium]MDH5343372.1 hypothetical protein [Betaproteobacteria bacterium]
MSTNPEKLRMRTLLGDYPNTAALKSGAVASSRLEFDFADVKLPQNAFKAVVRGEFDVAELAIVTYLQALAYGKPVTLLPTVVMAIPPHPCIACNAARGPLKPTDLHGKRVGIRAHSVTTVTWVRGILANDYGVDLDRVNWVSFEDPHVPECVEPSNVTRAAEGKNLLDMLRAGELDAGVVSAKDVDGEQLKFLIPDPQAALARWRTQHGVRPLNHVMVVHHRIAREHPWVGAEVVKLLQQSAAAAPVDMPGLGSIQSGIEALRPSLELIIHYAAQQGLIPRKFNLQELFTI